MKQLYPLRDRVSPASLKRRQTHSRRVGFISLLLVNILLLAGCDTASSVLSFIPLTGSNKGFQIHEYAIVDQSVDNPNHVEFQQRVQSTVSARLSGWHFPGPQDSVQAPNAILASYGYRLEPNPTPPFSGYALFHNGRLVERDIARFWPVSVKDGPSGNDFLLAFETMSGVKLYASTDGMHPWPAASIPGSTVSASTPPIYFGDQLAYVETAGSEVSVFAGSGKLYTGAAPVSSARNTNDTNLRAYGKQHWVLELNGHLIQDGVDLNKARGYSEVFQWQEINSQPFYFYSQNGIIHISYAGKTLPYTYDQVVHGNQGQTAIFNPGSNGHIIWYYALRDGVWYYIEAGFFQ